jgi:hypothetical protein
MTRILIGDAQMFPVQSFFNSVGDSSFVSVIRCLCSLVGYSIDDADCTFPGDLDHDEEKFDGARFSIYDNVIIISLDELYRILQSVVDEHLSRNHRDQDVILQHMKIMSETIG